MKIPQTIEQVLLDSKCIDILDTEFRDDVIKALNSYAQQHSIAFGEWLGKNTYLFIHKSGAMGYGIKDKVFSIKEIFKLYLEDVNRTE